MPSFPYKKVLIIGATSGIGLELGYQLVKEGVHVIAVGRRQERLDSFVASSGTQAASGHAFDIADIEAIPGFVEEITRAHPDLDCVMLNAGVQYVMDFSKPHTVDIKKIQNEINVNYISMVALTHALVPFFQKASLDKEMALMYTTTSLMSLPYPMVLNYSASKAALHSFILSIREQFKQKPESKINVVELVVPLVQTELHDGQPGVSPDFNPGMPVKDFCEEAIVGFKSKSETVAVGQAKGVFDEFEAEKGRRVGPVWAYIKKNMGKMHTFD
ncbi:NADP-dependent dehydrogenase-like protein [Xylariaceae sp. FL0804]|nr:NADP-dependent dehydrogenase-like protein [Xylariaceae sp. FL0804]